MISCILLFFLLLGLVAYPNWKRVLRLSFAFSLLSLELLTLSRAFENLFLGLGFGFLSFGIPYSLITSQAKKSREFPSESIIVLVIWVVSVIYFVANKGTGNLSILLKIASIALLDGLGVVSLSQKPGKAFTALTLLVLWALIWIISDHILMILGMVSVTLYIAHARMETSTGEDEL
ncbi:hypothetical protein [Thermococcus nautili]|uniref:hypothetical protein n=1 Tax=Thermococcus nautili TaxID=195522 RepID=UPI0025542F82|nr:hypothetical protein [Thermococcus nautili]